MEIIELLEKQGMGVYKLSYISFEERVKLQCFSCSRYNIRWTCPPKIPQLDYEELLSEYENKLLVWYKAPIKDNIDIVRVEASNKLHKALLCAEEELWNNNYPLAISFIGGSCKLCLRGCNKAICTQSTLARIPIEALGINVVKTAERAGIEIVFPPKEYLYRVGLLAW